MKHLLVSLALATATLASLAPLHAEEAPATTEMMWSRINVSSIKPTLSARNVYAIRGMHNNGVSGGWTIETSYAIDQTTKVVRITLAAHAPKGSRVTRNLDPVETKVEIKELAGPAYSGAPGNYDVVVVDRDGTELARTVYMVKPKG
ncbi:hypothetical protein BH11MYX1_BH11MYX1_03210 [soil metagenome]